MTNYKAAASYAVLTIVVISNSIDIAFHFLSDQPAWHLIQEVIVISLTMGLLFYLYIDQRRKQMALSLLVTDLKKTERSLQQSNSRIQNARKEYSLLIHQQFDDWQLSQGQKEIGLLLLKGLSFNEIAAIRDTKEKTVRQQASEIYKKAEVNGRHEFAAWFFEDFF